MHTRRLFFWDVSIRNSLRSNKSLYSNKRLQCVRLILVLVWKKNMYGNKSLHRNKTCLGFSVGCTRYVRTWYVRTRVGYVLCTTYVQPGISSYVPGMSRLPKIRICRYFCTRATSPPKKGTEGANAILSGTDLASYLPIKCLYCSPSHELSTNHILASHEESSRISARALAVSYTHLTLPTILLV